MGCRSLILQSSNVGPHVGVNNETSLGLAVSWSQGWVLAARQWRVAAFVGGGHLFGPPALPGGRVAGFLLSDDLVRLGQVRL